MRLLVLAVVLAALSSASAEAQNTSAQAPRDKSERSIVVPPQDNHRATTGQAPRTVPGTLNQNAAKGGATGGPNPDRVAPRPD
jgi:hypothetical protein